MKRDIRDGKHYKKQGKQEAAYPIPLSLAPMPHCLVTVLQRYWDGVCSLFFHLFFIICLSLFFWRIDFLHLFHQFFAARTKHVLMNSTPRNKMQVALLAEPKTPLESSVFI